jgi:NTP pyrophosphatase (non-canonical NTP hydrolase)/uncharacterized protein YukE
VSESARQEALRLADLRELLRQALLVLDGEVGDDSEVVLRANIRSALAQTGQPLAMQHRLAAEALAQQPEPVAFHMHADKMTFTKEDVEAITTLAVAASREFASPSAAALIAEKDAEIERLKRFFESKSAKSFYVAWKEADERAEVAERALTESASQIKAQALTFDAFRASNVARCLKWHPTGIESWSPSDWLTAVTGELGELASLLKMRNRERDGLPGNKFSPTDKQVADELADVFTYLDLLAAVLNVNLGQAVVSKFNEISERVGFPDRINLSMASSQEQSAPGGK